MRVISNWDAENAGIEVEVTSGDRLGSIGKIVGHNGKSMKYGRLYNVKLQDGSHVELSGSGVKRVIE